MSADDIPGGDAGRDLFGIGPAEFTAARNALAKQLRSVGEKAEAALVARLRRPPATAWALNKLARERPDLIDAVVDAGGALRAATEQALAGDGSALRTAQAGERRVVDAATTAAAGSLAASGQGSGDGPRQRMAGTLRAAMVDPGVADALRAGVLDDDRDATGFGLDAFSPAAADTAGRRRSSPPARREPGKEPAAKAQAQAAVEAEAGTEGDGGDEDSADVGGGNDGEGAARREGKHGAERAAATEAAEVAQQQAARMAEAAEHAEREAQAARDAAVAARAEAELAATRAAELEAAADTASTDAATARSAAKAAVTRADQAAEAAKQT